MSLVELILASGLLLGSSAASLGVWNRVATTLLEHLAEVLQGRAQGVHIEGVTSRAAEAGAKGIAPGAVVVATNTEAEGHVSAHAITIRGKTKEGRP